MTIRLGTVVRDTESEAVVPGIVVKVVDIPANEYGVRSAGPGGATITVADRNEEYPPDDPVVLVVFAPILRRNMPNWKEQPMKVIQAYRQGSFRSSEKPLPVSRLEPLELGEE